MSASVPLNDLTTDRVPPAERAGYWSDIIWRAFGRLRSSTSGDEGFFGHIRQREFGGVWVSRLEANAHRVVRTAANRDSADPGHLKLVVQRRGHSVFEQDGRRAVLSPGTWSLYDTTRSYTVSSPDAVRLDVLLLPREALIGGHAELQDLLVRRLPAGAGMGRVASEAIREASESPPGLLHADTGDAIVRLVRLALLEQAKLSRPLRSRDVLRERVLEFVSRHLADPALDADAIAAALHCSKRSLHKAFEGGPCTLAQHIWEQRLESARSALEQPAGSARSITEVAFSAGFSSAAHFSRAFRARFGASPRDWRLLRGAGLSR